LNALVSDTVTEPCRPRWPAPDEAPTRTRASPGASRRPMSSRCRGRL